MMKRLFPFLNERSVPFTNFSSCHIAVMKAFEHANAPVYSCLELYFRETSLKRDGKYFRSLHYATKSAKRQGWPWGRYKLAKATLAPFAGFSLSVSGRQLARYAPRTSASGFCSSQKFHHYVVVHPTLLAKIVLGEERTDLL